MRPFLMTSIAAISLMTASCAEAGPETTLSKSEIEALVKDYILENPEIIRDAIIKLQEKEVLQEQETFRESIVSAKDALENDPRDASIGPKNAKVTIVEFSIIIAVSANDRPRGSKRPLKNMAMMSASSLKNFPF